MKIRVKTFASVRELCGFDDKELIVSEGINIRDVLNLLKKAHKKFNDYEGTLLYAVNEEYRSMDTVLSDGDLLAVFPPVSGG